MKVQFYKNDTESFLNDTHDILLEHEAQNSILISNAYRGKDSNYNTENWFCATVKDDNGSVLASAMCTPPFNIIVYETGNKHDESTVNILAQELFDAGYILPGITGEKVTSEIFAEYYSKLVQKNIRIHKNLNAMQLDNLSEIDFAPGYLREITEEDLYYTPYWERGFINDCQLGDGDIIFIAEKHKSMVGQNVLYVWIDKNPVSMAGNVRSMTNGATIGRVYTPPFYRNKGYCTACVWHLSKIMLDQGNKFVSLYADADNPVSNKIYQKIGFGNVCLYQEIRFE